MFAWRCSSLFSPVQRDGGADDFEYVTYKSRCAHVAHRTRVIVTRARIEYAERKTGKCSCMSVMCMFKHASYHVARIVNTRDGSRIKNIFTICSNATHFVNTTLFRRSHLFGIVSNTRACFTDAICHSSSGKKKNTFTSRLFLTCIAKYCTCAHLSAWCTLHLFYARQTQFDIRPQTRAQTRR